MHTLLYIKQITNEDLLHSTGDCGQYLVITCNKDSYTTRIKPNQGHPGPEAGALLPLQERRAVGELIFHVPGGEAQKI